MSRTYPELGKANVRRMLEANGVSADLWDEQEYDDSLWPSENIALVSERTGVRTTRAWRDLLAQWRNGRVI